MLYLPSTISITNLALPAEEPTIDDDVDGAVKGGTASDDVECGVDDVTKTGMNPRAILISEIQQSDISFSNPSHPLILNFDNQCVKNEHFNPTTIQANKPEANRFIIPIHTQKPKSHTSSAQLIIVVSTSIYPIITTSKTPISRTEPK